MNGHNLSDKHECSAYLDKEIIKKLLEVDDITEKEHSLHLASSNFKEPSKFHSSGLVPNSFQVQGKNFNTNSSNSSTHRCSSSSSPTGAQNLICGWFVDPKVVCRGTESCSVSKGKSNSFNHNVLLSLDSGKSHKKSVFRHYSDPRAYIEQYRQENKCNSVTKFEPSESQSSTFYEPSLARRSAYQQISAPSTLQHNSVDPNSSRTNQLQRDQAVKKEYQKKTISANFLNNLHKYKLSHNFENQEESSPEQKSNAVEKSIIRDNERAGNPENTVVSTPSLNSTSVQKIRVSKLNLSSPSSSSEMSSLNLSRKQSPSAPTGSIVTNQFLSRKIGSPTSQPRGLDPLVWTSGKSEKQEQPAKKMTGKEKPKKDVGRDCKLARFVSPDYWLGQTVACPEITSQSSSDILVPVKDLIFDVSPILTVSAASKCDRNKGNGTLEINQSAQSLRNGGSKNYRHKSMIKRSWSAAYLSDKSKLSDQPAEDPSTDGREILTIQAGSGNLTAQQMTPGPYLKFWNSTLPARASSCHRNKSKNVILRRLSEIYRPQLSETDQNILEQTGRCLDCDQHAAAGSCGAQDFNTKQDHAGVAHKNKTVPTQTPRPFVNKLPEDKGGKEVYPHLASLVKTSYKNKNVLDLTYKGKCKDFMALSCKSKCKDVSALITGVLNLQYSFQDREMTVMAA